ncbi:recombinase family protein [Halobacterium sp. KA-4]|uniref:recombinase family protein n=1 Tax=Halobacterium sp. KA-4 TaxID=2896367 RepID=UPI001E455D38|nr:recombinase family protein [Halobacterium sp. KA-4]MCD2200803.1 recombinase family protein [Halobacterium sp. KA-4]
MSTEISPRVTDEEDSEASTVAIYARTSSKSQQFGYSLDEQVRQCVEHSELRGWTVQFIYRDEAESGKDTDRPMFQKMMSGAKQRWFDVIMFWKLDRFSRSLMHAVQLEADLRESDVGLFSVTEQIDTTSAAGRFNFRNIASAAEFERDMIQQRTQMGLQALAMDHKWPNDRPPLGYTKLPDGRLSIDSEEADLIQEIFRSYLGERSMPAVAGALNDREVPTKAGNQWCPRAVGDVLRNELYTGQYSVGDLTEYVDEYRIIPDELFEEVTDIRLRFQTESMAREKMQPSRKQRIIDGVIERYSEFLKEESR